MGVHRKDVRASLRALMARPDCGANADEHHIVLAYRANWPEIAGEAAGVVKRADAALRAVGAKTRIGGAS